MTGLTNIDSTHDAPDGDLADPLPVCPAPQTLADPETWRNEVAARLARYRTRRKPRAPRYPSLLLPFESFDNWSRPPASASSLASDRADDALPHLEIQNSPALGEPTLDAIAHQPPPPATPSAEPSASFHETSVREASFHESKILEFPRSAAIPIFHGSSLADPIFDRPRIVEAPEVLPPPPALGGILIEAVQKPPDPRAGSETTLRSASIPRRLLANILDGLIVLASLVAFAAIFLRFNPVRQPLPLLAATAAATAVLLWIAYQFLFIVYTGSTPGLRAVRLQLAARDGSPVSRRTRCWRVVASFLSAFSAGLGYLWCFMDPDSLCWHDRITKTHLRLIPKKVETQLPASPGCVSMTDSRGSSSD